MEFSPEHRKSTTGGICCVSQCNSKKHKNMNLSFHKVPKRGRGNIERLNAFGCIELVDKRSEWLKKLNISNDTNRELLVCSLHFEAKDYNFPDQHAKLRILKKTAVPMQVNVCKTKEASNLRRHQRLEQRQIKRVCNNNSYKRQQNIVEIVENHNKLSSTDTGLKNTPESNIDDGDEIVNEIFVKTEPKLQDPDIDDGNEIVDEILVKTEPNLQDPLYEEVYSSCKISVPEISINNDKFKNETVDCEMVFPEFPNKMLTDKGTQVSSGDFLILFSSFIQTERDLITMCNIKSFAILNELSKLLDEVYPPKRRRLLSTRDCILLTTMKLKLDIPFDAIRVMFKHVSGMTVQNIFYATMKKLSTILQSVVKRVSNEEIERNMPKCLNKHRATTSVFDCTEIKIQEPKCLKCRVKYCSDHKGDLSVKFMTEVTSAGLISFVSEVFEGRASNKRICSHSNVKHLESTRDADMADKSFVIDDECMQKRIQLIRPVKRNEQQFGENEAVDNRGIASARVPPIERMNQRIKQFQIMKNEYPWKLINYIDDIFIICCGLSHLGTPIVADDKF